MGNDEVSWLFWYFIKKYLTGVALLRRWSWTRRKFAARRGLAADRTQVKHFALV